MLDKITAVLQTVNESAEQLAGELSSIKIGLSIGIVLFLIAGLIIGFVISTKVMKRQLKKNPPISKDTIRMIYSQVGRKPSEAQVNEIFNRANRNQR
ncbi:YneF family protein [Ureaplasma sp. ES3154-GEN]|uniref:YneF family protein n=1 Tax=Ureaplasma sp. ES3154-GEN TaxID=2984844 RepID=UPI0021E8BA5B|nr:YneF family protein [Ureaplasma sp. ES3154-GEN]MCV3743815.1 YneF family protein [Ureaplasma sp. ES3154-GEN]